MKPLPAIKPIVPTTMLPVAPAPIPVATLTVTPNVPYIPTQTVSGILTALRKPDGTPLVDYNQALSLESLKFQRGDNILTLEDRPFIYEIVGMLSILDFPIVYNFLNAGWEKAFGAETDLRRKIIFENPLLEKSKDKLAMDMEIYRSKVEVTIGAFDCRKCHSQETLSVMSQTRSADEAATIKVTCLQCNHKWKAQ